MSGISTGTAIAIAGGVGAAGAVGGAAISANAAGNAAGAASNAADYSANLQYQATEQGLQQQEQQWQTGQAEMQPWLQSGQQGLANLDYLLGLDPGAVPSYTPNAQTAGGGIAGPATTTGIPGTPATGTGALANSVNGMPVPGALTIPGASTGTGAPGNLGSQVSTNLPKGYLTQPWTGTFQAPTAEQARQTPGYQFLLDQGTQALQNSAAAKGDLLSGNTMAGMTQYGQGLADTTYNETYNRALQGYQTNYNTFKQNQADIYNRLAAMSGTGQVTAQQLGSTGAQTANSMASLLGNSASSIGNTVMQGTNTASGYNTGAANAYGNTLSGLGGTAMNSMILSQLLGQQGQGYSNQQLANQYAGSPYADIGSMIPG